MKEKKITISFYTTQRIANWLEVMAQINDRPKSYLINLALEHLIEQTGGYGNGEHI